MKLMLLLILGLFNLYEGKNCNIEGQLHKNGKFSIKYEYSTYSSCVYLDTSEFSDDKEIELQVTIYDAYFWESDMYYDEFDGIVTSSGVDVKKYQPRYSSSSASYTSIIYYDEISYYYKIPKPSKKYLYVALPRYIGYSYSNIEIKVSGINIGLIVGIVVGVAVVAGVVIFLVIFFRRRRFVSNPNSGYVPQTNVYTPPTTAYAGYPPTQPVNPGYPSPQPNLY